MAYCKSKDLMKRTQSDKMIFYDDIIDFDEFDENKIKIDKKGFNDLGIYFLGYEYKKKLQNVM